jgi:hypothetical protein
MTGGRGPVGRTGWQCVGGATALLVSVLTLAGRQAPARGDDKAAPGTSVAAAAAPVAAPSPAPR